MSRIAKKDAAASIDQVVQNIKAAAGTDGVISRANIKTKLETLTSTEKALTDMFFRFTDKRDAAAGARVTGDDLDRASAYAKEHMLAKYDENKNGYSKGEIAKMSRTGQLAVKLAAEKRGIALPPPPAPSSALGKAITDAAKDADYISESDSTPAYVETKLAAGQAVDGALIMSGFKDTLVKAFDYDHTGVDFTKVTFEQFSDADARDFMPGMAQVNDPTDAFDVKNAAAWAGLGKVLSDNLTDVKVFKVGPKDEQTGKLATDRGAYELFVVGKTADGKLAGITFEAVET